MDGYLLIKEADGSKRQALDKNGNPTKNYIDVRESDRNKLIFITTELASISQTVSDGIACTSIVTSTENGAAIFYQQVDDNGSKIYMDANTIGIHSDYFNLNNSGLEMTGNLLAKTENGIITAGVIGNDTAGNDIRFFAGPNHLLSPITKQKLIRVKNTTNTNDPSQIFVRYPSLDKKTTGCYIGNTLEVMGINDSYNYYANKYQYSRTFEYNGGTYYMWINIEADVDFTLAVLTTERDYTTNNLQYHNKDFSLTPKIVTYLKNDEEYSHKDPDNLTYIVAATSDTIYVDDFYDAYVWVLDSNSEGVSLYDYHNSSNEQLDTNVVIYTKSENVNINDELGIQLSPTETSSYKVIDVSPSPSDAIEKSAFRVYEDGIFEATKGKFGCLEIGVEEWIATGTNTSKLEGTIYENNDSGYLSPDEISGLGPNQYYTHYIQMSPEIFQIDAFRGNFEGVYDYEYVKILPLGDSDRWDRSGLVEIQANSDESTAIFVEQGTIKSNHFRGIKEIAISSASGGHYSCPVETVMSNLSGLNIAFIVSDKTQFKFKFTKDINYEGNVIYDLDIYLNDMKILTNGTGHFENSLTEVQKNSISVNNNITSDSGIWKYKNTYGYYENLFGCYTSLFNKALQPSTLFIQLGTNGNNGSIYLGNIKIVG